MKRCLDNQALLKLADWASCSAVTYEEIYGLGFVGNTHTASYADLWPSPAGVVMVLHRLENEIIFSESDAHEKSHVNDHMALLSQYLSLCQI